MRKEEDIASTPLIRTFSTHYREKYGKAVGKIPLDLGIVCPNREKGGCIFCRPAGFTPNYLTPEDSVGIQLEKGKQGLLKNRFRHYLAYFQQECCTAAPTGLLLGVIERLLEKPDCLGLIISTRPDHILEELLSPLADLLELSGKECLFELGLQSIHERSLQLLNRNHTADDFFNAHRLITAHPRFQIGTHLIFGIPGETTADMLDTVRTVARLGMDALKLHHLQVLRGTVLEDMYLRGEVATFTADRYMNLLLQVLPFVPSDTVIHRLWTASHPNLLVSPKWNVLATHLSRQLRKMMKDKNIRQGSAEQVPVSTSSSDTGARPTYDATSCE